MSLKIPKMPFWEQFEKPLIADLFFFSNQGHLNFEALIFFPIPNIKT